MPHDPPGAEQPTVLEAPRRNSDGMPTTPLPCMTLAKGTLRGTFGPGGNLLVCFETYNGPRTYYLHWRINGFGEPHPELLEYKP